MSDRSSIELSRSRSEEVIFSVEPVDANVALQEVPPEVLALLAHEFFLVVLIPLPPHQLAPPAGLDDLDEMMAALMVNANAANWDLETPPDSPKRVKKEKRLRRRRTVHPEPARSPPPQEAELEQQGVQGDEAEVLVSGWDAWQ
jgi:hypothetical protein